MNGISKPILVTFLLSVMTFLNAVSSSWPSYTLKLLESDNSPIGYKITKNQGILIGSLSMLGSFMSVLVAGYISNKIGRKKSMILSGLCAALAWSVIATAKSVTPILIGRFVIGLGVGIHFVAVIIYISEICKPSQKGPLISIVSFMYNTGVLMSYLGGWFCSYDVINYINLTIAVTFILLMMCIKESPIYLLSVGQEKEALKSLMFYRGATEETQDVLDELVYMKSQLINDNKITLYENSDLKSSVIYEMEKLNCEKEILEIEMDTNDIKSVWNTLCTSKPAQRSLVILIMQMVLAVSMGMIAVQVYAGQFFSQAVPTLSPHICSVLMAIVMSFSSGVSVFVTDLFPRRVLMISTCILSAFCMGVVASMLRWNWAPDWGIPLAMVLFCIVYHIGAINLAFVQIAECLSPQINSFGSSIIMSCMFVAIFNLLFVFQPAVDYLGLDIVFLGFGIICLITAAVSFLFMRETRRIPCETTLKSFEKGYLYRW